MLIITKGTQLEELLVGLLLIQVTLLPSDCQCHRMGYRIRFCFFCCHSCTLTSVSFCMSYFASCLSEVVPNQFLASCMYETLPPPSLLGSCLTSLFLLFISSHQLSGQLTGALVLWLDFCSKVQSPTILQAVGDYALMPISFQGRDTQIIILNLWKQTMHLSISLVRLYACLFDLEMKRLHPRTSRNFRLVCSQPVYMGWDILIPPPRSWQCLVRSPFPFTGFGRLSKQNGTA